MTKTTKKADAYNITKDALTKAFNITFNGVYSSEVKTFMFNQHFRWSKTNKCFYGWTKDIQSLSNKIRELVFNWRNAEIKTNFIECPLIMADDIQTVHVYQNKCDYIAACKKQPEAVVEKITIDELLNDDDPAIVQTVANVITKEKEASLDAKKDEKIEKVTNSQELEATLDEYWKRWIYIGSKLIESYEDIVNASNEIARVMLRELDFSEFKHSAYSEPESPTLEELTNYALYHTYNPETAAEHVTVTKLNNPEYIRGVNFCGTKCASIEEAMEDIEEYNKDFDPQQHVMQVQAYIDFDNEIEYQKFIHLGLMKDQSWLIGENHFGGSCFVNLETLEGIEDVNKTYYMPKEERIAKSIGRLTAGVILRVNGENKIAVDPEGYSYARYIGILPTEEVIYVKPSSDVWFTKQEQEYIKQAERGESWSTIDFGARRSQNEHFWNKLRELGTVKLDSCMWSFKGAAA